MNIRLMARAAVVTLAALAALLAACAPPTTPEPTDTPTPTATATIPPPPVSTVAGGNPAPVASLEVAILESFPVQVNVIVKGNLPDSCTPVGEIEQKFAANTFYIYIPMEQSAGANCAQVLTPYEQTIHLNVRDLPKGTYTVKVNGTATTFDLTMDNTLTTPTP
jgi:hypothetical protein